MLPRFFVLFLNIFVSLITLSITGCGGGAAEVASAPIETTPVTPLVVHNNYEGVWKERCTEDLYIRVGNYIGPAAYRLRTRTVQLTIPILNQYSYVDKISLFNNNTCSGEPLVRLTQQGEIRGESSVTLDGKPAERASITVYLSIAENMIGYPTNSFEPFIFNSMYFPQAASTDLVYFGYAVILKSVQQMDGNKWYFIAPAGAGSMYSTSLLKQYWLEKVSW